MTTPDVQRLGPAVLLQGAVVPNVRRCLLVAARSLRRDGIATPTWLSDVIVQLGEASVSGVRRHDAAAVAPDPHSDQIGTREAAQMLTLTQRQVQRLARSLDGRRLASGIWVFDRDAVRAYGIERTRHNDC